MKTHKRIEHWDWDNNLRLVQVLTKHDEFDERPIYDLSLGFYVEQHPGPKMVDGKPEWDPDLWVTANPTMHPTAADGISAMNQIAGGDHQ